MNGILSSIQNNVYRNVQKSPQEYPIEYISSYSPMDWIMKYTWNKARSYHAVSLIYRKYNTYSSSKEIIAQKYKLQSPQRESSYNYSLRRCKKYKFDTKGQKKYQWFDLLEY